MPDRNPLEHYDPEFEQRQSSSQTAKENVKDFVVDQVFDPLNLVGLGAGKAAGLLGKAAVGLWGATKADDAQSMVLGRLPKGARDLYEQTLKEVLDSGVPMETAEQFTFSKTGVYKGADGKLRYYVPDHMAKLNQKVYDNLKNSGPVDVMQILDHAGLFEAAPYLKDAKVGHLDDAIRKQYKASDDTRGMWDADAKTMYLDTNQLVPTLNQAAGGFKPGSPITGGAKDTMLHELQHVAQGRTGLPKGGSPEEFMPYNVTEQRKALAAEIEQAKKQFRSSANISEADMAALVREATSHADNAARIGLNRLPDRSFKAFTDAGRKLGIDPREAVKFLDDFYKKSLEMSKNNQLEKEAFGKYRRLHGESEARMTQENAGRDMREKGNLPRLYQLDSLAVDPNLFGITDFIFK